MYMYMYFTEKLGKNVQSGQKRENCSWATSFRLLALGHCSYIEVAQLYNYAIVEKRKGPLD